MAFEALRQDPPLPRPAPTTNILGTTIAIIVGVVIVGGIFGATWPPGILLTALASLVALFVILTRGAQAMNEPGNFGQGLTAVIAAVFLLPAAIAAAVFVGAAVGVSGAIGDFSPGDDSAYAECLADPDTTFEDCEDLNE